MKSHFAFYLEIPLGLQEGYGLFFHPCCPDGRVCRGQEEVCPGCISETVRFRKLMLSRDIC